MKVFFLLLCFPLFGFSQAQFDEVEQLFAQKQFVKAETLLSSYILVHPNNLKAIELLGDALGHQKKWDEAIYNYKKLVDTNPNNANYQFKYGGVLGMKALIVSKFSALSIIDDVKAAFLKAAELDPSHIETRWALVKLYMELPGIIGGSKNKSLKFAEELEQLSKVDGYLAKGYIYEYDNELQKAETYYKLAVTFGGSITCYDKLTKLYEKQKQPLKAIATIEEAQKKHHHNLFNYQIGKVAAEFNIALDKGEKSLFLYLQKHVGNDNSPTAWAQFRLAQIYKFKGNKKVAIEYINLALKDFPKSDPFLKEKETILRLQ
jgi:tetratricopeptide (TPR) repeat protein